MINKLLVFTLIFVSSSVFSNDPELPAEYDYVVKVIKRNSCLSTKNYAVYSVVAIKGERELLNKKFQLLVHDETLKVDDYMIVKNLEQKSVTLMVYSRKSNCSCCPSKQYSSLRIDALSERALSTPYQTRTEKYTAYIGDVKKHDPVFFIFEVIERAHQVEFDGFNIYKVKLIEHSKEYESDDIFCLLLEGENISPGQRIRSEKMMLKTFQIDRNDDDQTCLFEVEKVIEMQTLQKVYPWKFERNLNINDNTETFKAYKGDFTFVREKG